MKRNLVISFIGVDQPGLVRSIADVVSSNHGNWLESRMSQLASQFAGVAVVEVDEGHMDALKNALTNLEGISSMVQETEPRTEIKNPRVLGLNIVGPDRPGILHDVTMALESNVANVVEMETNISAAPMSGDLTFSADARIEVPYEMDWGVIADQLDEVAIKLGVDILLDDDSYQ
ncbi:MAG: ACT domain-containing protein [Pseudomonadales bacterium]|jgi:glycine cleavage system regulatory protein|nr:ACT domain-containing protein [Pseudomonadales bacterium]MDP6316776.1 ACT domain-containing protein [Pseudomonadales bacterium]MDP7314610.1 ACT domain-containing protein [Pseudomonadales bacterium]MDP7575546.1 ACT domain-containing protein [Pseudomonadales bacterium]|tara:strand:- start:7476 stop:8000 length:525 start_codon:yes stop_codon:yes gene_type:complete